MKRLMSFLATIYAGNNEVRHINLPLESLIWHGKDVPHKMLIIRGNGGDGKSVYQFISPSVFEVVEEFRKQAAGFSSTKFVTNQGGNGGN